jgi:large subunit ribosomal protein L4
MSTIKVFNATGEPAGELALADELLTLNKGDQAVKDTVVAILNARRAGTGSTQTKGEVAGSGKKPYRQKGTGNARAGSRRSPIWRGGGVALGPRPRSFAQKVNRKVALLAFRRALSAKIADGQVVVVETLNLPEAKTKLVAALLKKLDVRTSGLFVTDVANDALIRAARNIPKVEVARACDVDVYSLLRFRTVIATRAGLDALKTRLAGKAEVTA